MPVSPSIPHALASESAEFDGFGGGIVRKPKNRPAGAIHAVVAPTNLTACGLRLDKLHLFAALSFERSDYTLRCRTCIDALRSKGFEADRLG
jgi:hypothetical protein